MIPTAVTPRADTWPRGTLAAVMIGAALLAALNLLTRNVAVPQLPAVFLFGTTLRLGIVVPIFFGVRFGPVVGFCVGAIGTFVSDLLTFGYFWNWEVGVGLIGAVAGLAPYIGARRRGFLAELATAVIMGPLAIVAGTAFASLTDIWVARLPPDQAINAEWLPVTLWDLSWGALSGLVHGAWWARQRKTR